MLFLQREADYVSCTFLNQLSTADRFKRRGAENSAESLEIRECDIYFLQDRQDGTG